MPMVAELPITMLACARIGAIHSVVFGGFSGEACGMRAADSGSSVLIYMDGYYRSGKMIDHKASAEIAVAVAEKEGQKIDKVLVWKRYPEKYTSATPMVAGTRLLRRRGPEGPPPRPCRAGSARFGSTRSS
jgi:acetyl-CoA synthetase